MRRCSKVPSPFSHDRARNSGWVFGAAPLPHCRMSDEIRHAFATSAQLSPAPVPTIYRAAENLGGPASLGNDHQTSFGLQPSARILSVVVPSGLWPHVEKRIGRPWTNNRTLSMRIDIMFQRKTS